MDFNLIIRFDRFNSANLGTESIPVGNIAEKKENGGFGDSGISSQEVLDMLHSSVEIPVGALSLNLTSTNQVYDINNTLIVEGLPINVPADIKVINTYLGGKIRLFKLTDSTENVNVTVYFDNTSTKSTAIELFDENNVFISSTSFEKNTVAALFYDKDTDLWTVTPITPVSLSEIYKYNPVSKIAEITSPGGLLIASKGATLLGSYIAGQLNFFGLNAFNRTKKNVVAQTISTLTNNITNVDYDMIELTYNYPATADSQLTIVLNDTYLKGRQFNFIIKNNTSYKMTVTFSTVMSSDIRILVPIEAIAGEIAIFKVTMFNNYIIISNI